MCHELVVKDLMTWGPSLLFFYHYYHIFSGISIYPVALNVRVAFLDFWVLRLRRSWDGHCGFRGGGERVLIHVIKAICRR